MSKLATKKINELIKDEWMAYKEYNEIAEANPEYNKIFTEMSQDEFKHFKYLSNLKEQMKKSKHLELWEAWMKKNSGIE